MQVLPKPGLKGVCPFCGYTVVFMDINFRLRSEHLYPIDPGIFQGKGDEEYSLEGARCPHCRKVSLTLVRFRKQGVSPPQYTDELLIWPRETGETGPL